MKNQTEQMEQLKEHIRRLSCPCMHIECSEPLLDAEQEDKASLKFAADTLQKLYDNGYSNIDDVFDKIKKYQEQHQQDSADWWHLAGIIADMVN